MCYALFFANCIYWQKKAHYSIYICVAKKCIQNRNLNFKKNTQKIVR